MKKKPTLENEFIKIMNSQVTNKELVESIKYLQKSNVLQGIENAFCNLMLEQIEMFSKLDFSIIYDKLEIDNYHEIEGYTKEEIITKIDDFIQARKQGSVEKIIEAIAEDGIKGLDKPLSRLFFERYSRVIDVKSDYTAFERLEHLDNNSPLDISSAIEIVDNTINGLSGGTITSVLGNNEEYKSLWAINIAYRAILQGKNVLYFSIGCSKEEVYKRFLSRHSCDVNKFEKEFSFTDLMSDYDKENFKTIYNDFKINHLYKLDVYDESEFIISTHYNLQKLIVHSEASFVEKTGNGIDLIVIDDFSFMRLDLFHKCITNQGSVVNEYYNYLKDQSQNLLGTGRRIPILITVSPSQISTFRETSDIYNAISNPIKMLSDNILVAYGNEVLKKQDKMEVQVFQSFCKKTFKLDKIINVKYNYWYIEYNKNSSVSNQVLLEMKDHEKEELEQEFNSFKEDMNNMISTNITGATDVPSSDHVELRFE